MKQGKYVIKAVGYNMWVTEVILEFRPEKTVYIPTFTMIEEKATKFDEAIAYEVVENLNMRSKDVEYIAKEVEE